MEVNLGSELHTNRKPITRGRDLNPQKMAVCLVCLVTIAFVVLFIPCWNWPENNLGMLAFRNSCPAFCLNKIAILPQKQFYSNTARYSCINCLGKLACKVELNLTKPGCRSFINNIKSFLRRLVTWFRHFKLTYLTDF